MGHKEDLMGRRTFRCVFSRSKYERHISSKRCVSIFVFANASQSRVMVSNCQGNRISSVYLDA